MRPEPEEARGRFIAVIGPSGVGKDSVMAGLAARHKGLIPVRRVITRPAGPGEEHEPTTSAAFRARAARGDFVLSWCAHDLMYGIPIAVLPVLEDGCDVLANLSRGVLVEAAERFPRLEVLSLQADPKVLAERLASRARETSGEIASRLARAGEPLPSNLRLHEIWNDGPLVDTVEAASRSLYPRS